MTQNIQLNVQLPRIMSLHFYIYLKLQNFYPKKPDNIKMKEGLLMQAFYLFYLNQKPFFEIAYFGKEVTFSSIV
jgi:hypothetical protein